MSSSVSAQGISCKSDGPILSTLDAYYEEMELIDKEDKEMIQNVILVYTDQPEKFMHAIDCFNLDINYIKKDKYYSSYLTRATAIKNWDIVPYLIERGINLDHQDYHKATALMYAAYCGHLPTVGRLVLAGANMFLRDKDGDTALDSAKYSQKKIIALKETMKQ